MAAKLIYFAKVEGGRIVISDRQRKGMASEVASAFEGKAIQLTITRKKKQRSSEQNRYYWGIVIPCVLQGFIDLGHDLQANNPEHREWIHQLMKERFLVNGQQITDANGEVVQLPASTQTASTFEMMEYIDSIVRFAAESLNTIIPSPGEQIGMFQE